MLECKSKIDDTKPKGSGKTAHEGRMKMKKYRVNESEHFNLMSMYDHLKCMEIDAIETGKWPEGLEESIEEVEMLLDEAYCVGALVDWSTLKRIREIKDERQLIRYNRSLAAGSNERDAALAFAL